MDSIKINETPLRTSRNYNINNVTIENINIPKKIDDFKNIEIVNQSSKNLVELNKNKVKLTYGLSKELEEQANNLANSKIKIDVNTKTKQEIKINYYFKDKSNNLVDNIQIIGNEGTRGTIIIKYESEDSGEFYHNGIIKLEAKKNADIKVIIVNLMNKKSNNFLAIENKLEENSKVKYTIVDFGGKNSVTNYYSNILENGADNNLETIYLGTNDQLIDLNYIAELRGEKTNANIEVQGALKDNAIKNFKGTIDFKKGAIKAKGNENEFCMMLSDKAKSKALPMLLCTEEDVEGNHSTASGKVNDKELFYLMARGFSKKDAMKLMVKANFSHIINKIENETLRENILKEIDNRLN